MVEGRHLEREESLNRTLVVDCALGAMEGFWFSRQPRLKPEANETARTRGSWSIFVIEMTQAALWDPLLDNPGRYFWPEARVGVFGCSMSCHRH